jgi:CHAD domain-containing protein
VIPSRKWDQDGAILCIRQRILSLPAWDFPGNVSRYNPAVPKSDEDFPLAKYTDELADRLRALVPAALHDGEVEAIHQARVTTRRLRAALNLLGSVIPAKTQKPVAKTLRRLRRELGPLRDADVMLGHLAELKRHPRHAQAIEWLDRHVQARRQRAATEALDDAPPSKTLSRLGAWWGVSEQIAGAREAVDTLLAESLHSQLDSFTAAAEPLLHEAQQNVQGANPHAVRIAGKLLRYTVEMAAVEGHKLPKDVLRSFKKMQDALGYWHDYVVLAETAMEICVDEMLPATDPAMQQRVLDLIAMALKRSQAQLKKFADLWIERGGEISDAIRAAFPNPRAIIEPKTDPGPVGSIDIPAPAADAPDRPAAF